MPRFVLEIGTEELPPRFFPPALSQLREQGEVMLDRLRLSHGELKVYGTPRRLVLIVEEIAAQQAASVREERGPSAKVAFDAQGKPTKAAEGFARRHGVTAQDLVRKQTDQGEYVFAIVHESEAPAAQALASACPDLIAGLSFPKSMRWGTTALRFGRPVRWVLALLDDDVVEFELGGVSSGRLTRGHPVLSDGMHSVTHAAQYEEVLKAHDVILSPAEREASIVTQLQVIGKEQNADALRYGEEFRMPEHSLDYIMQDESRFEHYMRRSLLVQTTFLVERPTVGLGHFDSAFLDLPEPVLEAEMVHVQSYFPLARHRTSAKERRELLPCFAAVRDGGPDHLGKVIAGWESVLRAKLIDAKYFYEQDLKTPLADRADALKGVVFQEKLGTMYEKVERIRVVAADLAEQMQLDGDRRRWLDRAALLCKADLTTEMVTELPDLQGTMGAVYAHGVEEVEVELAIRDHHRPRFADDETPDTIPGILLALADKLDTVAACFAIGLVPSGSADPYGLRREGTGVVRLLTEHAYRDYRSIERGLLTISAGRLARVCVAELHRHADLKSGDDIIAAVGDFLAQRLETYLRENDVRYDLAQAALAVDADRIRAAAQRAKALREVSRDPGFLPTVMAATRVANILKGYAGGKVRPKPPQEESEKPLWLAYQKARPQAEAQSQAGDYVGLFATLAALRGPIDRYFEEVLVMAEDPAVRSNRLSTVSAINDLFRRLADFSLVVQA